MKLDIKEAWIKARGKREAEIQKGRVTNTLLKEGGKKAITLLKLAHAQPASTQPAYAQPASTQPASTQPASTQPASTQPAYAQPAPTSNNTEKESVVVGEDTDFQSTITIGENTPECFSLFKQYQEKSFKKAKTKGLFVKGDLLEILSLFNIVLLKKNLTYPGMNFSSVSDNLLKNFELCPNNTIENSIFMELVHMFRGDISDRDELKIKLFDLYKKANKPDRRIIDVLINLINKLPNEVIKGHKIEEQEHIVNYVDPILSPLLHDPSHEKLFFWLNCNVLENYQKRPDASRFSVTGKRIDGAFGFIEIKPDYKKNDALKTHEDLLRLSLFGMNALEEYDSKCIFFSQVIGSSLFIYGCYSNIEGATVVVELNEIILPLSLKELPGFVMTLDKLRKIDNFYRLQCFVKGGNKRKASIDISLDDIINCNAPKNKKATIDF